jgi:hypothetical protein
MPLRRALWLFSSSSYPTSVVRLTNVAAFAGNACQQGMRDTTTQKATLHTRPIAGPKPFHRALTPSAAIVFLAQSRNPE